VSLSISAKVNSTWDFFSCYYDRKLWWFSVE
jgi:hypothetical protein